MPLFYQFQSEFLFENLWTQFDIIQLLYGNISSNLVYFWLNLGFRFFFFFEHPVFQLKETHTHFDDSRAPNL